MNLKKQIEVMQHFADGGKIEYFNTLVQCWEHLTHPTWNWHEYEYRIKVKLVGLKIEEDAFGNHCLNFETEEDSNNFKPGMKFREVRDA